MATTKRCGSTAVSRSADGRSSGRDPAGPPGSRARSCAGSQRRAARTSVTFSTAARAPRPVAVLARAFVFAVRPGLRRRGGEDVAVPAGCLGAPPFEAITEMAVTGFPVEQWEDEPLS